MAFDGNGNWVSNFNAEEDRDNNIKILASRFDNIFITDIQQSFENCLTKDMQIKPQGNFDANSNRVINVSDPVNNNDAVNLATLNTKDGTALHKTGTETASGNKTFSGSTTFSGNITSSGTNTFSGSNTFSSTVSLGSSATATTQATTNNSTKVATTAFVVNVLKAIYPVGSVYIGTQNTCPMASFFGTWTLVSSGKALWTGTGSNGNSTIAAGLPNITGYSDQFDDSSGYHKDINVNGAFYKQALSKTGRTTGDSSTGGYTWYRFGFDASRSNSIYGKSSTVQPPAYVVNVWRRTA